MKNFYAASAEKILTTFRYFVFIACLLFAIDANALDYYWVGGTGNWSDPGHIHWATTSGGVSFYPQVPTSADNVFFDANSFTGAGESITIDQTQVFSLNMDWTGVTNNPTFSNSNNTLKVYGSLTLASGMTMSFAGPINFEATSGSHNITSAGRSFSSSVNFTGIGGTWVLQDALTTINNLVLSNGTLTTNDKTVNANIFYSNSGSARTLNMGASTFNISWFAGPAFWNVTSAGMTLNAGTSTINATANMSGWQPTFNGGGMTYNNLNFTGASSSEGIIGDNNTFNDVNVSAQGVIIYGSNTFHDLTIGGKGTIYSSNTFNNLTLTPGYTYTFFSGATQTINGTLTANGSCTAGIDIKSNTSAPTNISKATGAVTGNYLTLTWINATGGASFTANNSVNGGGNSGWTINSNPPQDMYWIGNGGNWGDGSHWSTTSGGAPFGCSPGSGDNVFFDANSFSSAGQTVTINIASANCKNMNWTGMGQSTTFNNPGNALNVYGSLTFVSPMSLSFSGPINFEATSTGQTITTASKSFGSSINFNGVGGGWTLQDALTTTNNIILRNGTLTTNDQTVNASQFTSNSGTARTLNMGASTFNISWFAGPGFWNVTPAGMTLNAGTSTINATANSSGWQPTFYGGGLTYNNLNFTGASSSEGIISDNNIFNDVNISAQGVIIYGSNTFHDVIIGGKGTLYSSNTFNNLTLTPGYTYTFFSGATQTINGTLTANGTCTAGIDLKSNTSAPTTIRKTSGSVTVSYITLTWVAATGGASFTANSAVDGGNNTGWTLNTGSSQNMYWVGNSGNWSDGNHWSTSSGGAPFGCSPGSGDNVFFDVNSFSLASQTVTLNVPTANCKNMTWTGVTNSPTFSNGGNTLKVYGSLTLVPGMTMSFSGPINFEATTTGQTVTSAGKSFGSSVNFVGVGGGWILQDALTTTNNLVLSNGTLTTNNQTVNANIFYSNSGTARTLNMGAAVFNISWFAGPAFWNVTSAGMTLNAGTSTINATANMSGWQPTFNGGGMTYNNLNFTGTSSAEGIIGDNNTFNDVTFSVQGAIVYGSNTFHDVTIGGNGRFYASNTFHDLTFTPAFTYTLNSGSIQTINGDLNISGTGSFPIRVQASSPGSPATFSKASDTVCADYIRISDNTATGGAVFNAGTNSQNLGGNTGWNFPGPSIAPSGFAAASNPLCFPQSTTITQSGGALGNLAYWQWYTDAAYTIPIGGHLTSSDASLSVSPASTTTYYLRAEWASCTSPLPGPSLGLTLTVNICSSTWQGTIDSSWFTATNWSPVGVPNLCASNVTILSGSPRYPVIGGADVNVGNVNIATGATITLQPNRTLNVCGDWTGGSGGNATVLGAGTVLMNNNSLAQTIDGETKFNILQINNGNGVTLATGANVSIGTGLHLQQGTLNTNDGTLRLLSTSATNNSYIDDFTLGYDGDIDGNIVADRYVPVAGYNQHFISSPVNTPPLSQLSASGPDGAYILPNAACDERKSDPATPYGSVFVYNDGHRPPGYCMSGNWMVKSSGSVTNGKGYSTYLTGNNTLSLTGTANTDNITVGNLNNSGYPVVHTLQGQPVHAGWNLVGNPYPSAIDLTVSRLTVQHIQNQVQVWKTTGPFAGSWQTLTITGTPGIAVIAPFQAFMVRVDSLYTGSAFTYPFYQSERVRNTNTAFYRNDAANTLKMEVDWNGLKDITTIAFNPTATNGFDGEMDANKPNGGAGRPTLYTAMNSSNWYSINNLPLLEEATTVPMGLRPEGDKTMTLTPTGIESFDATTYIYLEDKKTNTWHNLRDGAYTFTTGVNDNQNRFVLHFTPPATIQIAGATCNSQGMINIDQHGSASWNYTLADMNNAVISSGILSSNSSISASVSVGTYIITLTDNKGYTVVKSVEVNGVQSVSSEFTSSATNAQVQDNILFTGEANAPVYSWDFGDGASATGKVVSHNYQAEGVYNVSLSVTSAEGCITTTTRTVTITSRSATGIGKVAYGEINIWSNDNRINIDFSKLVKVDAEIELYNVIGQLLDRGKCGRSNIYTRQIDNTEAAYIIVRVKNNNEVVTRKVFISNSKNN